MKTPQIEQLLKALHAKNIKVRGKLVESSCPLAKWTHHNGSDNKPSFAVMVDPQKPSFFNCFSCVHGSLYDLLALIESYGAADGLDLRTLGTREARGILEGEDLSVIALPDFTEFNHDGLTFHPWTAFDLPPVNSSSDAMAYLKYGRVADGNQPVSDAAIAHFDLRVDTYRSMVASPYRTASGVLAGARGRCWDKTVPRMFQHYDYTSAEGHNNAGLVWYHEEALASTAPVIVVEGQYDVANVWQVYPHVVGGLSSKITGWKLKKLLQAEFTLWLQDNDTTGRTHQKKYMDWLCEQGRTVGSIDYDPELHAEGTDPAKLDPEWLREQLKPVLPLD